MSLQYDEYLKEHIGNVGRGLRWMCDNLGSELEELGIDGYLIGNAILRADEHDRSKYDAEEYKAYDDYFYGGNRSYAVKRDFDYAWLRHIHHNPHHWQHWVLIEDDNAGMMKPLEMPVQCVLEMIADWWSFSWKSGNLTEIFEWYDNHKGTIVLHPKTKKLVESILDVMESTIMLQVWNDIAHSDMDDEDKKYGIPEEKKFPMPDKDHVRSAIRFFNYVEPKYEKQLANAILARMEEYGMSFDDFGVGDENRFKKYIPKKDQEED